MTRPETLVVRLTDTAGPEERGKVDEISAHACINDMSVVRVEPTPVCFIVVFVVFLLLPFCCSACLSGNSLRNVRRRDSNCSHESFLMPSCSRTIGQPVGATAMLLPRSSKACCYRPSSSPGNERGRERGRARERE
jgi:hypothetical protein